MKIFNQFRSGIKKTSNFLTSNLLDSLKLKKIDQEVLEKIESILISADLGIEVTNQLIDKIKNSKITNPENPNEILELIAKEIEIILKPREKILITNEDKIPTILLFIGVNGSGKTTSIGKLIGKIPKNKKILIGACDTFRAAAVEQLKKWSNIENTDFWQGSLNQDPASVAYSATEKTLKENYDYLFLDTAGRLSNNANLINQLIKIKTVVNKSMNDINMKTVLVLDGTNGSNMITQVDTFNKSINVEGLIITKIDGTAKGGAIVSIAKKYDIPIHYVGLGEKINDLFEFNAKEYSLSLLDLNI